MVQPVKVWVWEYVVIVEVFVWAYELTTDYTDRIRIRAEIVNAA
jgi:hypothetical protein